MAAPVQRPSRRKRRREISAEDIATAPIEEFTQEASTKGSYACYIQPFIQFDNGWTSPMYPEAMQRSDLTREYILHNEIKPICSSFNVEAYLKVFPRNGRRRGTGVVSRPLADQFMKAVSDQRSQEICLLTPRRRIHESWPLPTWGPSSARPWYPPTASDTIDQAPPP